MRRVPHPGTLGEWLLAVPPLPISGVAVYKAAATGVLGTEMIGIVAHGSSALNRWEKPRGSQSRNLFSQCAYIFVDPTLRGLSVCVNLPFVKTSGCGLNRVEYRWYCKEGQRDKQ